MPTTTNFGWTTPADTDLVKDGAAAIRTALGGVDTSFVDLKGGTTGQVLAKASNTDLDFTWSNDAGISPTIVDAKGDLIGATAADTPARLAVGTNGQVLTADSTAATGLKWDTPASGSMTSIATGTLSGATVSITSISGSYKDLRLLIRNPQTPSRKAVYMQLNTDTTGLYGTSNSSSSTATSAGSTQIFLNTSQDAGDNKDKIDILLQDYTDTDSNKIGFFNTFYKDDTTLNVTSHNTFVYRSTSAITSIQLKLESAASWSGGTYILYGVN
jgi:hypothetical protein